MKRLAILAPLLLAWLPASATGALTELKFGNGMRVMVVEDHKLPTVHVSLMFKGAGYHAEPAAKAGVASLTAELLREGTETLTALQIAEKVDFMGAWLGASADWDRTTVSASALSRHVDEIIGLVGDMVQKPAFKPEELERARKRTLANITRSLDDADGLAARAFMHFLYGEQRYGLPATGTLKTVAAITREDVTAFHAAHFRADNAVMVVAGDVDVAKVMEALSRTFNTFAPGKPAPAPAAVEAAPRKVRILLLDKPDLTQAKISFGHVGIPREHPDYDAAAVMNGILGGSGFLSRLMQSVRSKQGLTYSIRSGFDARKEGGPWVVTSFTKNETAADAIRAAVAEIERLQTGSVPPKELHAVQNYLVGAFSLAMETPEARAQALLNADLYNLGPDYISTYPARLRAVTAKDVARAAQSLLNPSILRFVVVGNAAELKDQLSAVGDVEVRPHTEWLDAGWR